MAQVTNIKMTLDDTALATLSRLNLDATSGADGHLNARKLRNWLQGVLSGAYGGATFQVNVGATTSTVSGGTQFDFVVNR